MSAFQTDTNDIERTEDHSLELVDIHLFSSSQLVEIAGYIRDDTLEELNRQEKSFQVKETFYIKYIKRFLDIVLSFIAIVFTAPVNLVIGIITLFDVGRPIFFKQTRIGKNGKPFVIYKFRNMTNERDANGELLPPAERVTKWGRFVRKTSLDELLNFVSILKGDMSFIGPRPLISAYIERLHCRHLMMYSVRPGLECPILREKKHAPTWQDRLDNYAWYAENVSFLVDLKMCLHMINLVFAHESTSKRSVSANGAFLGYDIYGKVLDSYAVPKKYVNLFLEKHRYKSLEDAIENRYNKGIKE